jgi:predicted oxidoreductase
MVARLEQALEQHAGRGRLDIWFDHEVNGLEIDGGRVTGVRGRSMVDDSTFRVSAEHVVIASGGIAGGDLSTLKQHWPAHLGAVPDKILNGAHRFGEGLLHDQAASEAGASLKNMTEHWLYATGVHHPANRRPDDGLSLVPARSALWIDAEGNRIMNPGPLVGYTDTRHLVQSILSRPGGYSWQVLNKKIALKELAVSGCDFMTAYRFKKRIKMLRDLVRGNHELVERLLRECAEDFIVADSVQELAEKMTAANLAGYRVDGERLREAIESYDDQIELGERFFTDEQLIRLGNYRKYRGDRIRVCKYQKIDDSSARPLIAVRMFILSRKSLGGIETDLGSRVVGQDGEPVPGLYAVGEAAGFGGGGIHGKGSLEGTFLGSCILTGRIAAKTISGRMTHTA